MKTKRAAILALGLAVALAALAHPASAVRTAPRRASQPQSKYATPVDVQLALAELEQDPEQLFAKFTEAHGKVYQSEAERGERFEVFVANIRWAKALNAKRESHADAVFGVRGPFADLSPEEFNQRMLPKPYANPAASALQREMGEEIELTLTDPIPSSWDWRDHQAVTEVKNQGVVGTCWAFSATGSIEGQHALKTGQLVDLSTEQISDCDASSFPQNNSADCGTKGGLPYMAYEYVMRAGGIELNDDYPYCIGNWACEPCFPKGYDEKICGNTTGCLEKDSCAAKFNASKIATNIDTWASIAPDKNETRMAAELVQSGPVSVSMDSRVLQVYMFGILTPIFCSSAPSAADHAILLTGYGTAEDMLDQTMDYWEIKNSWGASWGEKGYFRVKRQVNTCGVANHATTAIMHR